MGVRTCIVTGTLLSCLFSACDRTAQKRHEEEKRLLALIRPKVEVAFSDEGPVTSVERGTWRSYSVRVTNHFSQPVYVKGVANPNILPAETLLQNPDGYCYFIMKQTKEGRWSDGWMGLQSTSSVFHAIAPEQSIEFKAPVRLHEVPMDGAVALRPRITVYCSTHDRNGIWIDATSSSPIPQ